MKIRLSILFLFMTGLLCGQGIRDSVFLLEQVEVTLQRDFRKEGAGMKETRIDSFLLSNQVHSTLSDLLSGNTTLHIKDYGRGAMSTVSFRGTAPSHTQVTWNGMNSNSPMLGMVDFSLIPVFIIDELNINHGAASVASQSGGLGGLIALENRPDWSNRFGGKLYQEYGSFGTAGVFAQVSAGSPVFQSKTRFYFNRSENNYPFVNKNIIEKDTITGELYHPSGENSNASFQKTGVTQEFYIRPSAKSVISNKTWYQDASRSVPTVLSSEFSDESLQNENFQTDRTVKNVTEYGWYHSGTKLQVRTGFDWQQLDYSMESPVTGLALRKNVDSRSRMVSWQNSLQLEQEFSDRLSSEFRTTFNRHDISTHDSATLTGYDTIRLETSLFGGLYYTPSEKIQLALQVRKDIVSDHKSPFIFAAGINFKPFAIHDFIVKGNVSRNYHHPTLNDLYWQPGGNPDLLPEEGYTAELSAFYSKKTKTTIFRSSLTGYYSYINNWIIWLPGFRGYWEPFNLKEVMAYGVEYNLTFSHQYRKTGMRLNGNIAVTNTLNTGTSLTDSDESQGMQLPFIPKISGNLFASVINRGFYLVYQNNSMGTRYLLSSNEGSANNEAGGASANDGNRYYTLYPHYLNKVTFGKSVTLSGGIFSLEIFIDNLFNETYRNVLQRFMPGRSYSIHLKYDF